ncbi:ABC transporter ATP-binding protein [Thermotoga profunda]|uniref:ABC transporter ATP-binding protein n=1 Tax=Thermotoga profunda TaxID=1508420 RepID=UPI0006939F06|nr:ABC transporter ATP-binding protein [Thermotoga profunda]
MKLLSLIDLVKEFPLGILGREKITAVDHVSFDIYEGTIFALIGESGSGKTTIGKLILGLLRPTAGEIIFKGQNISESIKDRRDYYKEIQGIFQDPFASFNPIYKIDRVFYSVFTQFFPHMKTHERLEKIKEVLIAVGLNPEQILGKYPHQLSGGQLQRILISRVLLIKPKLLIADEIISMLDASTRIDVLNLLAKLRDEERMSVLFITHDLSLAYYISDYALIMYKGNIVEAGSTQKVFHNPQHPYTQMLLESVPEVSKRWDMHSRSFVDMTESITNGCKYYSRCSKREKQCESSRPSVVQLEQDHWVMCHRIEDTKLIEQGGKIDALDKIERR